MSALRMMSTTALLLVSTALISSTEAGNRPVGVVSPTVTMKPFPKPLAGDTRLVIRLPARANESSLLIRVTPGKLKTVDCNTSAYTGSLETKTLQGWGYNFYVLRTNGTGVSTMMACPPSSSSKMAFVPVASAQQTLPYNSRMPLVYYVPKEFSIQYEVFAPQQQGTARPE